MKNKMEIFDKKYIKYFFYTAFAVAIITVISMLILMNVISSFLFRDASIALMTSFFISLITTVIYCTFLIMDKLQKK